MCVTYFARQKRNNPNVWLTVRYTEGLGFEVVCSGSEQFCRWEASRRSNTEAAQRRAKGRKLVSR